MAGRNGDIAEGNEHDHPVDVPDRQVGTQPTAASGNGHPPSDAPTPSRSPMLGTGLIVVRRARRVG